MREFTKEEKQAQIARNVAAVIDDDATVSFVNLGVGIPTLVADYLKRHDVYVMAENGMLGVGPVASAEQSHPDLINAGRQSVLETAGCSYTDSASAFGMIRGGYIDATVLGAFEVDQNADVANWIIPGGKQLGVGGAMDLVSGAKKVIIAMTHTSKTGAKLVKKCTLPLTAEGAVNIVVTEYAVFFYSNGVWELKKLAKGITRDELASITDIAYNIADDLAPMVE